MRKVSKLIHPLKGIKKYIQFLVNFKLFSLAFQYLMSRKLMETIVIKITLMLCICYQGHLMIRFIHNLVLRWMQ